MFNSEITCPSCGNYDLKSYGLIKGRPGIFLLKNEGILYECNKCYLFFRFPYFSENELKILYEKEDTELWQREVNRPDWQIATAFLLHCLTSGKVLDIGCFTGEFLDQLPSNFEKFGIETSVVAQSILREKKINIVGSKIEECKTSNEFIAITAFDVLEHLKDPLSALDRMIFLLKPGGFLIVSTANTSVWTWKISRNDFWYYFPDHVSFVCPKWFIWALGRDIHKEEIKIIKINRFSRYLSEKSVRLSQAIKFFLYIIYVNLNKWKIGYLLQKFYPFSKISKYKRTPSTHLLQDHFLVIIQKTGL